MTTQAQLKANRLNAQKSTGPRTAEGKAVVSKNAIKHGFFAADNVIYGENQVDFDLFSEELFAELAPVGVIESTLAMRIVSLSWRLRRAERMHNEALDVKIAEVETNGRQQNLRERAGKAQNPRAGGLELILGWATNDDFSDSRILERLMMYERRIEFSLHKAIKELERKQFIRNSKKANAEVERSVTVSEDQTKQIKKQSQLSWARISAKPYSEKDYEVSPVSDSQETNPIKADWPGHISRRGFVSGDLLDILPTNKSTG